jgi:hypothetical protein
VDDEFHGLARKHVASCEWDRANAPAQIGCLNRRCGSHQRYNTIPNSSASDWPTISIAVVPRTGRWNVPLGVRLGTDCAGKRAQ